MFDVWIKPTLAVRTPPQVEGSLRPTSIPKDYYYAIMTRSTNRCAGSQERL